MALQMENTTDDFNNMMYVCIHEMAHMFNNNFGHDYDFWTINKILL